MVFSYHQNVDHFLCELRGSSEAGGEKYDLTYLHSKAWIISLADGLWD
jgi:hypothetical protein